MFYVKAVKPSHGFNPEKICEKSFKTKQEALEWASKVINKEPEWFVRTEDKVYNYDFANQLKTKRESLWIKVQFGDINVSEAAHQYRRFLDNIKTTHSFQIIH